MPARNEASVICARRTKPAVLAAALFIAPLGCAQADSPAAPDPIEHWAFDLYAGALFRPGSRAPLNDHTLVPVIPTLTSNAVMRRKLGSGELVVRSRFSLLGIAIMDGPETHYVGLAAAPSFEWWNEKRTFSSFFSIGGGFGWLDSRGDTGYEAQGQDFNFNWFMHGGVRAQMNDRLGASLGMYFQHISNGHTNAVNPGIDVVGPMLGISWRF
jgi:hypothetical protein